MLIWKVIDATTGITRKEIWERVEKDIPPGYALRRYENVRAHRNAPTLPVARKYVFNGLLANLERHGAIRSTGAGAERMFIAGRDLWYRGNPDAIDETGTKAADHMAVAEALRVVDKLLASGGSLRSRLGSRQIAAIATLAQAARAKGPASS